MNKEVLAASLGLPSTATEAEINAKIADNKAKAEQAVQLQAKLDQQETDGKAAKITAMLNKGETDKSLLATSVHIYKQWQRLTLKQLKSLLKV